MSRILVGGATVALFAFSAQRAGAYELQLAPTGEPVRWHGELVLTEIDFADGPVGLSAADAEAAARRALNTWSEAGTPEFPASSESTAPLRIRFAMSPADPGIDPGALALTHLNFDSLTGELRDVEIAVNAFAFRWAVGDQCARGADDYQYDFESTLAHEVGHAVGLRHSEEPDATMFTRPQPCARERRDLAGDDLEAIAVLYGDAPAIDDPNSAPAGCSAAGGGSSGGAPLLLIAAVGFAVRRRRRLAAAAIQCAV